MIVRLATDTPYLLDPENWTDSAVTSIPELIGTHLLYTALALVIAAAIAIPVGLFIGHTGRLAFVAINAGNVGRSLPTLGLISFLVVLIGGGLFPALIALVILAIPPILTSTYAGLRAVDPAAVDAARGMGMRELQTVFTVEVPMALPLMMSGLRNAALQVVATATVAAYVGLGGLGRLLVDGLALNQYDRVVAGAVLVAALAILIDLLAELLQRVVVSPGVSGRAVTRRARVAHPSPLTEVSSGTAA
ncbi:ABC transporter permease subunit [Labedella phragmitis]|uniref:ABC transporter permease subunit n=1 Tax=Labedella phragmitis TaxID=2498849 RepID=A0A3S5CFH0_9MICO|nr:ABC transporter permease subunit [Labedella phragmitis]RWZ52961.1 ABC transporter permease subunit [Labedella phragmitis]